MNKPERSNYTSLDFVQWDDTKSLVLTPKFQRRGVWTDAARSLLIDTLIQGMPVPPIYLRVRQSQDKKRVIREVVDGQQRLASILKFVSDEFKLSKSLNKEWANRKFSGLSQEHQDQIRQYSFNCEVFQAVSDKDILEVFTRLNTYSIPLNNQELRNGRFFGYFKQSAYTLAHDYLEFWRKHGIFSERSIARMLEVELTSELMIAELDGLQDKKKSINTFYEENDERFSEQKRVETRFSATLNEIEEALGDELNESEFVRVPLFYSLFCCVYHRTHGLPKIDLATPKRPLTNAERGQLASALAKLSEFISAAKNDEDIPSNYSKFVTACLRQTDNLEPRRVRFQTLYKEAF
jgi:uncharacterized protein with ParB-like and HNH nuclease domain